MGESSESRSDPKRISGLAYSLFLTLGIFELVSLALGQEEAWGWFYFAVYVSAFPLLSALSVIIATIRQFFGLEIKLLLLTIVTVVYWALVFAGVHGFGIYISTLAVAGVITLLLSVAHYIFDRKVSDTAS